MGRLKIWGRGRLLVAVVFMAGAGLAPAAPVNAASPSATMVQAAARAQLRDEIMQLIAEDPSIKNGPPVSDNSQAAQEHVREMTQSSAVRPDATARTQAQSLVVGPGYLLDAGKNHTVARKTLAGAYKFRDQDNIWRLFICGDHNKLAPNGPRLKGTIRNILQIMPTPEAGYQGFTVWNELNDDLLRTMSKRLSSGLWVYENWLTRNPKFLEDLGDGSKSIHYKAQLNQRDPGVLKLVDKLVAFGRTFGPVKPTLTATTATVGSTGVVTLGLTSANGSPAFGRPATVYYNANGQATGAKSKSTNAAGKAAFAFKRVRAGGLGIQVNYSTPSWTAAFINRPSKGHQLGFVSGSLRVPGSVRTASAFLSVRNDCAPNCDGVGKMVAAVDATGAPAARYTGKVDGAVVKSFTVPAGKKGGTTYSLPDGKTLTFAVCYIGSNGKCGPEAALAGKFVVVCPAWPKLTFTVDCDCPDPNKALVDKISFGATIKGSREYEFAINVNGAVTKVNGRGGEKPALPTIKVKRGDKVKVTFRVFKDEAHKQPLGSGELFSDTWRQ